MSRVSGHCRWTREEETDMCSGESLRRRGADRGGPRRESVLVRPSRGWMVMGGMARYGDRRHKGHGPIRYRALSARASQTARVVANRRRRGRDWRHTCRDLGIHLCRTVSPKATRLARGRRHATAVTREDQTLPEFMREEVQPRRLAWKHRTGRGVAKGKVVNTRRKVSLDEDTAGN